VAYQLYQGVVCPPTGACACTHGRRAYFHLRDGDELDFFPALAAHQHHRSISRKIRLALNRLNFCHPAILRLFTTVRHGVCLLGFHLSLGCYCLAPPFGDPAQTVGRHLTPYGIAKGGRRQIE
jgi:hypothetical protein